MVASKSRWRTAHEKFPAHVEEARNNDGQVHRGYHLLEFRIAAEMLRIGPYHSADDFWAPKDWQLLLVVSEYCSALLEFLDWFHPDLGWDHHKQAIVLSKRLLQPHSPQTYANVAIDPQLRSAWLSFTYSFFNGTQHLPAAAPAGTPSATYTAARDWLTKLVGERGFQAEGLIVSSLQLWIQAMQPRLQEAFPGVDCSCMENMGSWPDAECAVRGVEKRGAIKRQQEEEYAVRWPLRVTQGRPKFNHMKMEARDGFSVAIPPVKNPPALGFLAVSDVMCAFKQAAQLWPSAPTNSPALAAQQEVVQSFVTNVLRETRGPLAPGIQHEQYRYLGFVACCVLGWHNALPQISAVVARTSQWGALPLVFPGTAALLPFGVAGHGIDIVGGMGGGAAAALPANMALGPGMGMGLSMGMGGVPGGGGLGLQQLLGVGVSPEQQQQLLQQQHQVQQLQQQHQQMQQLQQQQQQMQQLLQQQQQQQQQQQHQLQQQLLQQGMAGPSGLQAPPAQQHASASQLPLLARSDSLSTGLGANAPPQLEGYGSGSGLSSGAAPPPAATRTRPSPFTSAPSASRGGHTSSPALPPPPPLQLNPQLPNAPYGFPVVAGQGMPAGSPYALPQLPLHAPPQPVAAGPVQLMRPPHPQSRRDAAAMEQRGMALGAAGGPYQQEQHPQQQQQQQHPQHHQRHTGQDGEEVAARPHHHHHHHQAQLDGTAAMSLGGLSSMQDLIDGLPSHTDLSWSAFMEAGAAGASAGVADPNAPSASAVLTGLQSSGLDMTMLLQLQQQQQQQQQQPQVLQQQIQQHQQQLQQLQQQLQQQEDQLRLQQAYRDASAPSPAQFAPTAGASGWPRNPASAPQPLPVMQQYDSVTAAVVPTYGGTVQFPGGVQFQVLPAPSAPADAQRPPSPFQPANAPQQQAMPMAALLGVAAPGPDFPPRHGSHGAAYTALPPASPSAGTPGGEADALPASSVGMGLGSEVAQEVSPDSAAAAAYAMRTSEGGATPGQLPSPTAQQQQQQQLRLSLEASRPARQRSSDLTPSAGGRRTRHDVAAAAAAAAEEAGLAPAPGSLVEPQPKRAHAQAEVTDRVDSLDAFLPSDTPPPPPDAAAPRGGTRQQRASASGQFAGPAAAGAGTSGPLLGGDAAAQSRLHFGSEPIATLYWTNLRLGPGEEAADPSQQQPPTPLPQQQSSRPASGGPSSTESLEAAPGARSGSAPLGLLAVKLEQGVGTERKRGAIGLRRRTAEVAAEAAADPAAAEAQAGRRGYVAQQFRRLLVLLSFEGEQLQWLLQAFASGVRCRHSDAGSDAAAPPGSAGAGSGPLLPPPPVLVRLRAAGGRSAEQLRDLLLGRYAAPGVAAAVAEATAEGQPALAGWALAPAPSWAAPIESLRALSDPNQVAPPGLVLAAEPAAGDAAAAAAAAAAAGATLQQQLLQQAPLVALGAGLPPLEQHLHILRELLVQADAVAGQMAAMDPHAAPQLVAQVVRGTRVFAALLEPRARDESAQDAGE